MADVLATFTGQDGPLGNADTGQPWAVRRGSVTRKGGRGFAATSSPGPYAVVDAGAGGQDAAVSLTLGAGGGQAIYFRESDVSNWWRLSQRYYGSSYQTGTVEYSTAYQSTTGQYFTQYGPINFNAPPYAGQTNLQIVAQGQQPTYATAYAYELRLERCVNGTVTTVRSASVNALTSLRVVARGSTIEAYSSASPSSPHWTVTDATHAANTRHGFGYAETSEIGNSDGIDDFRVAPFNTAPDAPTVAVPSKVDLTQPFDIGITHVDPDNDTASQSFARLRPAGTTTWTVNLTRTGAQTTIRTTGNLLTAGDWEVQAATRDAGGLPVGDSNLKWSASKFLTAAVPPPGPTVVTPVAGAAITGSSQAYVISIPALDRLDWAIYPDLNGAPNRAAPLSAGSNTPQTTTDLRTFTATGLPNGAKVHAVITAWQGGLASPEVVATNPVAYTPPAQPLAYHLPARTLTAPDAGSDVMLVEAVNPAPVGSQPAVAYNEVHRRIQAVGGDGIRLRDQALGREVRVLPNGTYTDVSLPHGVELQWRLRAVGNNGTSAFGPWSTGPRSVTPTDPSADPVEPAVSTTV